MERTVTVIYNRAATIATLRTTLLLAGWSEGTVERIVAGEHVKPIQCVDCVRRAGIIEVQARQLQSSFKRLQKLTRAARKTLRVLERYEVPAKWWTGLVKAVMHSEEAQSD